MVLPAWKDLSPLTRRSPKKLYELLRTEINGAEADTYDISVSVDDGTNALGSVAVTLISGTKTYTGTTGSKGGCSINNVPAGIYTVSAVKTGYTYESTSLTVSGNASLEISMTAEEEEE